MALPYFPFRWQTSFMAAVTWFILVCFMLWFDPSFVRDVGAPGTYAPLFLLLYAALYWLLLSLTGRWKRTLLWTSIFTAFFWLRFNRLDSFLNLVLLFSFGSIWEYYWSLLRKSTRMTNLNN